LAAEALGGLECGWLHDVLSHVAFFQGDQAEGLRHQEAEIERARRNGDPYRLAYALADCGAHAGLAGNGALARQHSAEALTVAQRLGNPAVVSMSLLATAYAQRVDDPIAAIDWYRRAAAVADTIECTVTSGNCRAELALLHSLHGDALEAVRLFDEELRAFRRAGAAARVRGTIRHAIPALYRLVGRQRGIDIATLDAGTFSRPHIRPSFSDGAIAEITAEIASGDGDALARASRIADSLSDDQLTELALELIHEAMSAAT
jgi:hypothetical protein